MNSKRFFTAGLLIAVVCLCVAGTKLSRLTRTRAIQSNSLFYVVTQDASGIKYSRYILAPDLATNLGPWITNTGAGGAGSVETQYHFDPTRFLTNASGNVYLAIVLSNIVGSGIAPGATNAGAYVASTSGLGTNTDFYGLTELFGAATFSTVVTNRGVFYPEAGIQSQAFLRITETNTTRPDVSLWQYGTSAHYPQYLTHKAEGTLASPTAVQAGTQLYLDEIFGYGTASFRTGVRWKSFAMSAFSGSSAEALLTLELGNNSASPRIVWGISPYNWTNHVNAWFSSNIVAAGTVTVPEEAYGVGWDGALTVPTKNALYDKIEALSGVGEVNVNGEAAVTNATRFGMVNGKAGITNLLRSIEPGFGLGGTNRGTNIDLAITDAELIEWAGMSTNLFLTTNHLQNGFISTNGVKVIQGTGGITVTAASSGTAPNQVHTFTVSDDDAGAGGGSVKAAQVNGVTVGTNIHTIGFTNGSDVSALTVSSRSNQAGVVVMEINIPTTSGSGHLVRSNSPTVRGLIGLGTTIIASLDVSTLGLFGVGIINEGTSELQGSVSALTNLFVSGTNAGNWIVATNGITTGVEGSGPGVVAIKGTNGNSGVSFTVPTISLTGKPTNILEFDLSVLAANHLFSVHSVSGQTGVITNAPLATAQLPSGATLDTEWDTIAEIETAIGALNILLETEIDASSELRALMDDESGTGALLFADGAIGAATATSLTIGSTNLVAELSGKQSASMVLSNLVGTVANNVTNESSTQLQINSGTLTLSPGVLSNLVVSGVEFPTSGVVSNINNHVFALQSALIPTNSSLSNIVVNFRTNRVSMTLTNNATFTNYTGVDATTAADVSFMIFPQLINRGVNWPVSGASYDGTYFRTNANSPLWTTLTQGVAYVYSLSRYGTNVVGTLIAVQ